MYKPEREREQNKLHTGKEKTSYRKGEGKYY
jgi:hypothetical protein